MNFSEYIDRKVWNEFVAKRLISEWEALRKVQQERRAKNTNLHKLSWMGYIGLIEKMEKELEQEITDIERAKYWIRAQLDGEG